MPRNVATPRPPRRLAIDSGSVVRTLERHGDSLVTTRIQNRRQNQVIRVDSDEFAFRLAGGALFTARECVVVDVRQVPTATGATVEITYRPLPARANSAGVPVEVVVRFETIPPAAPGDPGGQRKSLRAVFPAGAPDPHHLEIERFRTAAPATRGGRGEPVVLGQTLVLLPDNPSQQTRHTDGNTPRPYSHRFERVGNHSVVELENGDTEPNPQPGLVRCLHFPLLERQPATLPTLQSQGVITLAPAPGQSAEDTVVDHIQPPEHARAFTHYNNWFDPDAKNLRGNTLPEVLKRFQTALAGSGIQLQALVPDNGWQDRRSVWRPDPAQFPNGNADIARLGRQLADAGSGLGLWIAIDNTTNDVDFARARGFSKAQPNAYFRQYFPHQSLADPAWQTAVRRQLETLANTADLRYAKLDFNHLSHTVPTDRHGHEAELKGFIRIVEPLRQRNVFVNATNWTWHAPAWRKLADTVWMLAGDDGFNGNFPEISGRAQATTDRDTFLWRMWGDPDDRPWFPISAIMTHGIIRNAAGQMAFPTDTPLDWSDHVLMHYGRGTLLREWYLSPAHVTRTEWDSLIAVHRWADRRRSDLIQSTFIGGRPDEGHVYGYVGWAIDGQSGTLVARNPSPAPQMLEIPLDRRSRFRDRSARHWTGNLVYPRSELLETYARAGEMLRIPVAGYETVAIELHPARDGGVSVSRRTPRSTETIVVKRTSTAECEIRVAPAADGRRSLLVMGYPSLPEVVVNGKPAVPLRSASGTPNTFASYAVDGMPSAMARHWSMAEFDLAKFGNDPVRVALRGSESDTRAEAWVLAEQSAGPAPRPGGAASPRTFPGLRRFTELAIGPVPIPATPAAAPSLSDNILRESVSAEIQVSVFGNSPGYGEKTVLVNGQPVGVLPRGGDEWTKAVFSIPVDPRTGAARAVSVQVVCPADDDKFKVGRVVYRVVGKDGASFTVRSNAVFCHDKQWPFFEGNEPDVDTARKLRQTPPVVLEFGKSD